MFNCLAVVGYSATDYFPLRIYVIVNIVLAIVDLLIQLFICYICIKLGAKDSLNRFDCFLVDDGNGGRQIKFFLKKNVPESIGVPHAANHLSE